VAHRPGFAVAVVLLFAMVRPSWQLRTGVAPTYIQTMRQITSYETNNIDTYNDAIVHMRQMQLEQYNLHSALKYTHDNWVQEKAETDAMHIQNDALRAQLTVTKNTKVYNDDQSFREIMRNRGLEPQNVALTVTKTTQDDFIWQTNRTNGMLTAHAVETQARNAILDAEKKEVWLSIERNERDEWYWHENSIAVEAQLPKEAILKEYHDEQVGLHESYNSDLTARNAKLSALVPGLTAERDAEESAKLDAEIETKDAELGAAAEEQHVVYLQKAKTALERVIMQYQMANTDLTSYNDLLKLDITALTAERDVMRTNFEEMWDQRNAAQIKADHWEVLLRDMTQKHNHANSGLIKAQGENTDRVNQDTVCTTQNTALKAARTALVTTNQGLRNDCF